MNKMPSAVRAVFERQQQKYYACKFNFVLVLLIFQAMATMAIDFYPWNSIWKKGNSAWLLKIPTIFLASYCSIILVLNSCCVCHNTNYTLVKILAIFTCIFVPILTWIRQFIAYAEPAHKITDLSPILSIFFLTDILLVLPLPSKALWIALLSVVHTVFLYTFFQYEDEAKQMAVTILLLVAFCTVLLYNNHTSTVVQKSTFDDFERAVEKKTNVEFEKDRQDQLLLSIIPIYLADKVRRTILNKASKTRESITGTGEQCRLFYDLHVQEHDNVSILYADIVKFTLLTISLTPGELVRFLNELYTRFDTLAQENNCMRIKILGDCYYCVSGIPYNQAEHADNCVKMGLAMIKEIKSLRKNTGVDMDMRIGVHSGAVLCGIVGSIKWQYDIWSDDVTLANRMESEGQPGKVHITKATLQELRGRYTIEEADLSDNIETFFVVPSNLENQDEAFAKKSLDQLSTITESLKISDFSEISTDPSKIKLDTPTRKISDKSVNFSSSTGRKISNHLRKIVDYWGASTPFSNLIRRRSSKHIRMQSIQMIQNTLESQTVKKFCPKCAKNFLWCNGGVNEAGVQSDFDCLLRHRDTKAEAVFWSSRGEPHFSSTLINLGALLVLASIKFLYLRPRYYGELISLITGSLMGCACAILMLMKINQSKNLRKYSTESDVGLNTAIYTRSKTINFLVIISAFLLIILIPQPQIVLSMCQIFLLLVYTVTNVSFVLKTSISIVVLIFVWSIHFFTNKNVHFMDDNFDQSINATSREVLYDQWLYGRICNDSLISIFVFFLASLFAARLAECEQKMNWLCLKTFKGEHEDIETMRSVNEILLRNILPETVADHFLRQDRDPDAFYYQRHDKVCVMFASIPNFKTFWSEWDFSKKLECLRFLNEIVCDFDKFLQKPKFSNVEKIKTVASTYMAAAGLRSPNHQDPGRSAKLMVEFAFAMMNSLEALNRDAFQNFQLRIGLSFGPVIAGVVAAQKPQYDIFGNTVNLASRMDTHGEMGKIHATSETADALKDAGYEIQCRGYIHVKGVKDQMQTFFIMPPCDRKSMFCDTT